MKVGQMTPWFSKKYSPPSRVGVYRTDSRGGDDIFQYWNGKFWGLPCPSVLGAHICRNIKSLYQSGNWRGFREQQK